MAGPTSRPFLKAFVCAAVAYILAIGALYYLFGPPGGDSARVLGYIFGTMILPAIVTGLWAWLSRASWGWIRFGLTYVGLLLLLAVVQFGGHLARQKQAGKAAAIATVLPAMRG